jgi:hypothetical protein
MASHILPMPRSQMRGDMFPYLHCLVHNKLKGNFTLMYVYEKKKLAWIFHNYESAGTIKYY